MREIVLVGRTVRVEAPGGVEKWEFASPAEALAKAAFVEEALTWIRTPFVNSGDIKGLNGAVDCAMLMVRCAVDTGLIPRFDPRPYSSQHMLHSNEEQFLGWVEDKLGGRLVDVPRFGDVAVWKYGRVFAHGGIVINSHEVVHAYAQAGQVIVSRLDEHLLRFVPFKHLDHQRPLRFYDVWSGA